MGDRLERVFAPLRVGALDVANRIVRAAHDTGFGSPGITPDHIAYHVARARGGCGLTILEASSVHPSSRLHVALFRDAVVDELRALADAVRPYGMRLLQQLWHGGNLYPSFSGGPPWAVSDVPGVLGTVGRVMARRDLAELRDAFVAAAVRCEQAGLDGIEVHACHGYLFHQFLTAAINTRDDEYGGDFDNRARFLFEVLRGIRATVGSGFAVGVRLGASEAPGGVSVEDNQRLIRGLEREGLVDFVDVSVGDYYRLDSMVGAMQHPTGYELSTTAAIASVATVPRILTGRVRTLEEAEQILRSGSADLVSMVRAQIADPDLVRKSREGRFDEVRPCIGCNQGCIGGLFRTGRMGCLVNPEVGFEAMPSIDPGVAAPRRRVLVIGGGPAGLEAARVAAAGGHDVTLAEAHTCLGGTAKVAATAPYLAGLGDLIAWLESEIHRLGVKVLFGSALEIEEVRAMAPDSVIVATGAQARTELFAAGDASRPIQGVHLPHVLCALDLLTQQPCVPAAGSALVYDTMGHYEAIAAVEVLLQRGMTVTHVTPSTSMSPYLQTTWRDVPALERFQRYGGFTSLVRHTLVRVSSDHCTVRHLQGADQLLRVPADVVVLVVPGRPRSQLFELLREDGVDVHLVGDAHSPRDAQAAIAEGYAAARSLR